MELAPNLDSNNHCLESSGLAEVVACKMQVSMEISATTEFMG